MIAERSLSRAILSKSEFRWITGYGKLETLLQHILTREPRAYFTDAKHRGGSPPTQAYIEFYGT